MTDRAAWTVCAEGRASSFLRIEHAPVSCNHLCSSRCAALREPGAAVSLGFCPDCSHFFNVEYDAGSPNDIMEAVVDESGCGADDSDNDVPRVWMATRGGCVSSGVRYDRMGGSSGAGSSLRTRLRGKGAKINPMLWVDLVVGHE